MRIDSSYVWLVAPNPDERGRVAVEVERAYAAREPEPWQPDGARSLAELETEIMIRRYVAGRQPLFARLPFDYRLVPSAVRAAGLVLLDRLHAGERGDGFPRWPHEPRLDDLRASVWADAANRAGVRLQVPRYPDGHRGAVLLTHDIDSRVDIGGIPAIRALERRFNLPSSVGFIPRISWPDRGVIEGLVDEGCEVYCHDLRHDGKLPYQGDDAIRAAFERFFDLNPYVRPLLHGFRSGQLLVTARLLRLLRDWFSYDLSLPDSEHGGPYGPYAGCASVHPFLVDGLLEIPLTLPQDFYLVNVEHYDSDRMLSVWRDKLEAVLSRGGVAVVNTHPVWTNVRRPGVWAAYEGLLETVAAADAWVTTPSPLYRWFFDLRGGVAGGEQLGVVPPGGHGRDGRDA